MKIGIILVHGYTGAPGDLRELETALAERFGRDAVSAPALPGHGADAAPAFSEERFVSEIGARISALNADGRGVVLVGHSTGGVLALAALARTAAAPLLLVLASSPRAIDGSSLERWERHRAGGPAVAFGSVAALVSFVNREGRLPRAGAFPVMVLQGERDDLVPPGHAFRWEQGAFAGPVRTVLLPRAGHHLFRGADSAAAIDLVLRAVEDLAAPASEQDEGVIRCLTGIEPEAARFLAHSPASSRHIARSPSGQHQSGRIRDLGGNAETEPVIANIEITTRCNLSCAFCARAFRKRAADEDMPPERFRQVLDRLPHAYRVSLVGLGEPLLHPGICDLVNMAASRGRRVGLVTNAMLLTPAMGAALLAAGLDSIAFSIDAPDQELASELRRGTDLGRVIGNITAFVETMRSTRTISTAVFTAASERNVPALGELVDLVSGLGVHVLMLTDLNFVQNRGRSVWRNADDGVAGMVRGAVARAFSKKLPVLSVHGLEEFGLRHRYDRFLLLPPDSLFQRSAKRTWCSSPWQTMPVNVRGEASLCDCQPDAIAGDLIGEPFSEVWNGPAMTAFRGRMLSDTPPEACLNCPRF